MQKTEPLWVTSYHWVFHGKNSFELSDCNSDYSTILMLDWLRNVGNVGKCWIPSTRRTWLPAGRQKWHNQDPGMSNLKMVVIVIIFIIITRPKPAYGRQGLAGSWGQDTDEVSTFLVFLTSHFPPAALSSDLTNLGPLMTMKIHLETLKNHGNQ